MAKYVQDYVKKFGLDKFIRYNLEVINVEKKGNWFYDDTNSVADPGFPVEGAWTQ